MTNAPAYDFLGFKLLSFDYSRMDDGEIDSFSLKATSDFSNGIYTILIALEFEFKNNEKKSNALFASSFKINDIEWYGKIVERKIDLNFFSTIVFPFIRTMVYSITNDSRKGIQIPTFDLNVYNLSKGITLKFKNN